MNLKQSVLIIDDEPVSHALFIAALKDLPLVFSSAFNGESGLSKIASEPYDLVLLDIMMPNLNGLEMLQEAEKQNIALPITVVCSNFSDKTYVKSALSMGVSSYLYKQSGSDQIRTTVCDFLFPEIKMPVFEKPKSTTEIREMTFHSLTQAMAFMVFNQVSGKIIAFTDFGNGELSYLNGKLRQVNFNNIEGIEAIDAIREIPIRKFFLETS
jgi:YesN/AraC family two-component response regulator